MVDALLQVSKLQYRMPPALGIVSRRNYREDYFQRSEYNAGSTMILDCQTGSDFVDSTNSYLVFNLTTLGVEASLASGSAFNIANRVLIKTRTGREWSRVENSNLITKYMQLYSCNEDWLRTLGKSQGYTDDAVGKIVPTDTGTVFVVPLWAVAPCFNRKELCPSQTMEGLRIEIYLESTPNVFRDSTSGAPTGYTINNPRIVWDCFDLGDAYKRKIAEMASRQGLNLLHKELFHTIVAAGSASQTSFNFDVKKAASKALKCHIVTRAQQQIDTVTYDSLGSLAYDYSRIQAHIGADYFPQFPLECNVVAGSNAENLNEVYYQTMFAHGKTNQCYNPPSVTPEQYDSQNSDGLGGAPPKRENCMISINLNKSNVSDLQGYVVNTSRALIVDLQSAVRAGNFPDGNGNVTRRLDVYLEHLRVLKQYVSNAEIRD
jgi:hypothetical protein